MVYYPIPILLTGGIEVKKHLEIIRELGLIFLLFVLAGAVAASDDTQTDSDDTHTVSVTITQTSAPEEGDDAVTNTYNKEIETNESTDVQVTGVISEDEASVTTNVDDMPINMDDTTATETTDSVGMPDFEIGESTPEEINKELSIWISSIIDDVKQPLRISDFSVT